ncbi:hypothetical protein GCM10010359_50230 [Streptomyces morookaense]|nr:hypothetical protein GCM10010359_50230 [Streptomyces morookaense]
MVGLDAAVDDGDRDPSPFGDVPYRIGVQVPFVQGPFGLTNHRSMSRGHILWHDQEDKYA